MRRTWSSSLTRLNQFWAWCVLISLFLWKASLCSYPSLKHSGLSVCLSVPPSFSPSLSHVLSVDSLVDSTTEISPPSIPLSPLPLAQFRFSLLLTNIWSLPASVHFKHNYQIIFYNRIFIISFSCSKRSIVFSYSMKWHMKSSSGYLRLSKIWAQFYFCTLYLVIVLNF